MDGETICIIAVSIIGALCWGYVLGGRSADQYWADHADNGSVCHKGKFYRVTDTRTLLAPLLVETGEE